MATFDFTVPEATNASAAALHQLKELLQSDPGFAQAMRATPSSQGAARLAADHGILVTPEALWRNRGTLGSGGIQTWRG